MDVTTSSSPSPSYTTKVALSKTAAAKAGAPCTCAALEEIRKKDKGNAVLILIHDLANLPPGHKFEFERTGGTVHFGVKEFVDEWPNGGKFLVEDLWRLDPNVKHGSALTDSGTYEQQYTYGQHEWIPTDLVSYVVEWAQHHREPIWIHLASVLRVPTRYVVLKPKPDSSYDSGFRVTGHVGAVYLLKGTKYVQQTAKEPEFHEGLREILRKNLNKSAHNLDTYHIELKRFIKETLWQGDKDLIGESVDCPYYFLSLTNTHTSWGKKMGNMRHELQEGWKKQDEVFEHNFELIRHTLNNPIPSCLTGFRAIDTNSNANTVNTSQPISFGLPPVTFPPPSQSASSSKPSSSASSTEERDRDRR